MQEQEFQVDTYDNPQPKGKSKKNLVKGCGCGCLVIILIFAGLGYWFLGPAISFVMDFSDQGYTITGDQYITVEVDETVEGDVLYFANTVTIDGTVNGNLAVICDQLIINGTVNGNLDLLCDRVTVTETGLVTGDLKALAVKSVIVEGVVQGEITGEISRKQLPDTESGADPDLE